MIHVKMLPIISVTQKWLRMLKSKQIWTVIATTFLFHATVFVLKNGGKKKNERKKDNSKSKKDREKIKKYKNHKRKKIPNK